MLELTYVDKGSIHSVAGGQDWFWSRGTMAITVPISGICNMPPGLRPQLYHHHL